MDYLKFTNDIFLFEDYPEILYPVKDAFVITAKIFLNRNAEDWYEFIEAHEHVYMNNGLIKESSFDLADKKRTNKEQEERRNDDKVKQFVEQDEFKRFMIEMGIIKRCIFGYDPQKRETDLFVWTKRYKRIFRIRLLIYSFHL